MESPDRPQETAGSVINHEWLRFAAGELRSLREKLEALLVAKGTLRPNARPRVDH
jgi:hypothetical protein